MQLCPKLGVLGFTTAHGKQYCIQCTMALNRVHILCLLVSEEAVSSPPSHVWSTERQSSASSPNIGLKVEETTDVAVVLHS